MGVSDWANWAQITGISLIGVIGGIFFLGKRLFGSSPRTALPSTAQASNSGLSSVAVPLAAGGVGVVVGETLQNHPASIDWTQIDVSSAVDAAVASGGALAAHTASAIPLPNDPNNIIDHLDAAIQVLGSINDATGG